MRHRLFLCFFFLVDDQVATTLVVLDPLSEESFSSPVSAEDGLSIAPIFMALFVHLASDVCDCELDLVSASKDSDDNEESFSGLGETDLLMDSFSSVPDMVVSGDL